MRLSTCIPPRSLPSKCGTGEQQSLPELPAARRARYVSLGLPPADAVVLADEPPTAAYFDAVLAAGAPAKPAANWVMGDVMAFCKARCPAMGFYGE